MDRRTRRGVLAACGAAVTGGCVGGSGGTTQTGSADGAVLAYVRVANYDDAAHTLGVLVERNDEIVHWSNHELAASDGAPVTRRLDGSWGESGSYTIHTRLDDTSNRQTFDANADGTDCYGVETRITTDAATSLWLQRSPDSCTGTSSQ